MKWSFLSRIIIATAISLVLNAILGSTLKSSLSQKRYTMRVSATYPSGTNMELFFDSGSNFNQEQKVRALVRKGLNRISFPFSLKEGEQLKFVRLDLGTEPLVNEVEIHSVSLMTGENTLFALEKDEIVKHIRLFQGIAKYEESKARFLLETHKESFDPYIVFHPLNELVYPLWQRTLLLLLPWLLLFFFPAFQWIIGVFRQQQYLMFFVALFVVSLPLKIAWVSFTTLLLLSFAVFTFLRKGRLKMDPGQMAVVVFFLIPLIFLGEGEVSKLKIPLGFLLFPVICALVDFSKYWPEIKKIYIKVFFVLSSVTLASWVLLMWYNGYYYNIGFSTYFSDIKTHAHSAMFWLYYPHTTFLSLFIIVGGVFCMDLYRSGALSRPWLFGYAFFGYCAVLLLGSRFAWILALALPLLYDRPLKKQAMALFPAMALVFGVLAYFIPKLDPFRAQLWKMSWVAFREKIWLGHGTGTSENLLQNGSLARKAGFDSLLELNHSHNQYLTYLLENGLLGLCIFLLAFGFLIRQFVRHKNRSAFLVASMTLFLMLIESPFRTTTSLYAISFLLCVFSKGDEKEWIIFKRQRR